MQKNQNNYSIQFCSKSDLPELQKFLDRYWKRNHVLSKNKELMDWQHYNKINQRYNFIIAKDAQNGLIQGILGYIPNRQFDETINLNEIFLAIWKVVDSCREPMLGIKLLKYLADKEKPDTIFTIGLNSNVMPLYKKLGYKTGFLNHYYIINKKISDFHLISNFNGFSPNDNARQDDRVLKKIKSDDIIRDSDKINKFFLNGVRPRKSISYILNKYLFNPFHDYCFYGILKENNLLGIIITRTVNHNQTNAIRLVELAGFNDSIMNLSEEFQKLLINENAEYLDFYNLGLSEDFLSSSGFISRAVESNIIIPNYFEPFERKNVNIAYAFSSLKNTDLLLFKGDGDQDRPNIINDII